MGLKAEVAKLQATPGILQRYTEALGVKMEM